nr:NB-ARC domain-containing protein [Acidimicrobiia bacterium]
SAASREVLGDAGLEFIDLGEHRLRDLTRPEHVYQLQHEGLPEVFPPLASLDARPNNLPIQLTTFIGRDREVRELCEMVAEARLVTLTGIGGTGKTRLSLQVAAELAGDFADGAWLVELAAVSDPELVANQAAEPFGVRAMKTDRPLEEILGDYLAEREMLLLLDNCEHVVESSGGLAEFLLTRCSGLRIVATSRELLGVPGEIVYRVPPMEMTGNGDGPVEETEAVRLFAERAAQVRPGFLVDAENLPTLREITQRLDGLPLAIELAASRTNLLAPEQLLERLERQFRLMTSGRRERGRHTTVETALDWSYDLIPPEQQMLFRQLAVFTGGWTLEAAEEICSVPDADVLDLLGRLVDQSLVDVSAGAEGSRYRLLEPVRQYALAKLDAAGEEQHARRRHAGYFVGLAEASELGLKGPEQDEWVPRIEREHDNLRSAITWSLDNGQDELALRTTAGLAWFWWVRGYWREGMDWFHKVYAATPDADPVLRGRLVYKLAGLEVQRARPAEVKPLFEEYLPVLQESGTDQDHAWVLDRLAGSTGPPTDLELATKSLELFQAAGDAWGQAYASWSLGWCWWADDHSKGLTLMRGVVDSLVSLGDRFTAGWLAFNLGFLLAYDGRYDEGRRVIEETLQLVAGTHDRWVSAHCRHRLGAIATMTGYDDEALRLFGEALPVHRKIGDENCTATAHSYLGVAFTNLGRFDEARESLITALRGAEDLQNRNIAMRGLTRLGWLAAARGDSEAAARTLGTVESSLPKFGQKAMSVHDAERTAEVWSSLAEAVGSDRVEAWKAAGAALTLDEAIELALRE